MIYGFPPFFIFSFMIFPFCLIANKEKLKSDFFAQRRKTCELRRLNFVFFSRGKKDKKGAPEWKLYDGIVWDFSNFPINMTGSAYREAKDSFSIFLEENTKLNKVGC